MCPRIAKADIYPNRIAVKTTAMVNFHIVYYNVKANAVAGNFAIVYRQVAFWRFCSAR